MTSCSSKRAEAHKKSLLRFSQAVRLLTWSHLSLEGDPFAPCQYPTYPEGWTCLLSCFPSRASISCHWIVLTTKETDFLRGRGWKISSIWLAGKETSCFALLCSALHGFSLVLYFSFHRFSLCPNLYAFENSCIRCDHMAGHHALRSKERVYVFPLPWAFQEPARSLCCRKTKLLGTVLLTAVQQGLGDVLNVKLAKKFKMF